MLDDALVDRFAGNFFGYGRLDAPYWFVGMEEAGGATLDEVSERLNAWDQLGAHTVVDAADFHDRVRDSRGPLGRIFRADGRIQPSWGPLIRFLLRMQGSSTSRSCVRAAQAREWGRQNSETCLVELLPLPSQSADDWHYNNWSESPWLATREAYEARFLLNRITQLRGLIGQHHPQVVLFYGTRYLPHWSEIAGIDFENVGSREICRTRRGRELRAYIAMRDSSAYVCTYHPSRVNSAEYFEGIADLVVELRSSRSSC